MSATTGKPISTLGLPSLSLEMAAYYDEADGLSRAKETELKGLRETVASLQAKLQAKVKSEETLKAQVDVLRELKETLSTRCERFESLLNQQALQQKLSEISSQEERLRNYAQALSQEKHCVRQFARQLAEQIEMARNLPPLKDYLSLTEFELSKLELQLKKTPTSSPARPELEQGLSQLIQQRDFLRSVIDASRADIERQAAVIIKIAKEETLVPCPPLPPKKRVP
jgi:predicted RNase H-like nuclease (RuvC/YqgF family)